MNTGIEDKAVVQAEAAATNTELVLREADSLAITSDADFQAAAVTLREVKTHWKDLDDQRKELVRPIQESERRINDLFRGPLEYLARAERVLKDKIGAYKEEQDRLARLEQARLDELALIQAVAAGMVPIRAITVNLAFLNQMARGLKADLNYPGVRAVKETGVSASTGIRDQRALPRR